MFNKVFISYAREDYKVARQIYDYLERTSFKPWMDKKDLLLGQQFDYRIMNELRLSDFVIILLSKTSVAKRGYVQKEFKTALKYAQEKLNADIYILPIKLDDCVIPPELSVFNWAQFQDEDVHSIIVESLQSQRNTLLESLPVDELELNNYKEEKFSVSGEINQFFDFDISYPVLSSTPNVDVEMVNIEVKHYLNDIISRLYNDWVFNSQVKLLCDQGACPIKKRIQVKFSIRIIHKQYISILFHEHFYFSEPDPVYRVHSTNVALGPLRILGNELFNANDFKALIRATYYDDELFAVGTLKDYWKYFGEIDETGNLRPNKFEFLILEDVIIINFLNHFPDEIKSIGYLEFRYHFENNKIVLHAPN